MEHGHKTDTVDGRCSACGVTREMIDDDLAGPCRPAIGPDRLAVLALREEIRKKTHAIHMAKCGLHAAEHQVVMYSHALRELRGELDALQATHDRLMNAEPDALELARSVRRLGLLDGGY